MAFHSLSLLAMIGIFILLSFVFWLWAKFVDAHINGTVNNKGIDKLITPNKQNQKNSTPKSD
ncbi:hypothetical protein RBG61_09805 [Paludicola sp. MB14-C6]|uniref:hypothetical protein n=1 Tax=Paludihabitans sp. MB14-C6 TaxID=3070656 RepID=UPI0027DBA1F4|nr:hypothetical protein [Paludicola sp. MB14-C6]WMJ22281.1 hypothetical protein RBG61_09805 [Paludicola sp. MB14-C6]